MQGIVNRKYKHFKHHCPLTNYGGNYHGFPLCNGGTFLMSVLGQEIDAKAALAFYFLDGQFYFSFALCAKV
jgi:hypothetical protein